jgi:hypothetical protein
VGPRKHTKEQNTRGQATKNLALRIRKFIVENRQEKYTPTQTPPKMVCITLQTVLQQEKFVVLKFIVCIFLIHGSKSSAVFHSVEPENIRCVCYHQIPALNPMVDQDAERIAVLTRATEINAGTVIQNIHVRKAQMEASYRQRLCLEQRGATNTEVIEAQIRLHAVTHEFAMHTYPNMRVPESERTLFADFVASFEDRIAQATDAAVAIVNAAAAAAAAAADRREADAAAAIEARRLAAAAAVASAEDRRLAAVASAEDRRLAAAAAVASAEDRRLAAAADYRCRSRSSQRCPVCSSDDHCYYDKSTSSAGHKEKSVQSCASQPKSVCI